MISEPKYLAELEKLRSKCDDCSAERLLDRVEDENFSYEEYDEEEWVQDGKYQSRVVEFKLPDGLIYGICEARSGSPFTDWYNQLDCEWYCYDPLDKTILVRFLSEDRTGNIEGLFSCTHRELQDDILGQTIHFGEALGKHSDVVLEFAEALEDEPDLTIISEDSVFIKKMLSVLKVNSTISGYNPLDYK